MYGPAPSLLRRGLFVLFFSMLLLVLYSPPSSSQVTVDLTPAAGGTESGFAGEINKGLKGIGSIYKSSRKGIVALTVLAILGMGVAAYFGRFPWKWFWTLSGGLFLISVGGIALTEFLDTANAPGVTSDLGSSIFK